jgi:PAS domain S-box-containing protein
VSETASGLGFELAGDRGRLAAVVEAAPLPIVAVDRSGRIAMFNAYAEELFGYSRDELLGETLERLLPAASKGVHGKLVTTFLGEPVRRPMAASRNIVGLRKDGTEVPLEVGLNPVVTRDGTFVLAVIVDVAEHRRAELRLRAVVDSSPNALVLIDGAGNMTLVNTQAERLFGYRREELFGQNVEKLVPRRFRNIHQHQRNAFLNSPTRRSMGAGRDLYGLRKDGSEIPIEIGLNPLELPHGRFVLAAIIDISERKRAEKLRMLNAEFGQHALATADLEQLEQEATELVSSALRAPLVRLGRLDPHRGVLVFNAGVGWPGLRNEHHVIEVSASSQAAETIRSGQPIFLERVDEANPLAPSRDARELGIVASGTIPIRGKDAVVGLLHVGVREARRFSQDDVAFLVSIATIIGTAIDRDRREQRINQLNVELQHRYDELETFSYSVAHDLRAPLRSVAGFAAALEEDYAPELDDEAKRFIDLIVAGADQMGGLIDALLSLARVSRQEIFRSTVDLSAVAESIVTELRAADPGRNAIVEIAPGSTVAGDPALLRNLLANLIGNAWKFTRGRDPALISFSSETGDDGPVYTVKDNGIGFATEYPEQLFVPFKRLHGKSFEGTGIGLATVARIVRRHGGRAWAHSEGDGGATFSFTLGDESL